MLCESMSGVCNYARVFLALLPNLRLSSFWGDLDQDQWSKITWNRVRYCDDAILVPSSSVALMHHYSSDLGSLIPIRIIRNLWLGVRFFSCTVCFSSIYLCTAFFWMILLKQSVIVFFSWLRVTGRPSAQPLQLSSCIMTLPQVCPIVVVCFFPSSLISFFTDYNWLANRLTDWLRDRSLTNFLYWLIG